MGVFVGTVSEMMQSEDPDMAKLKDLPEWKEGMPENVMLLRDDYVEWQKAEEISTQLEQENPSPDTATREETIAMDKFDKFHERYLDLKETGELDGVRQYLNNPENLTPDSPDASSPEETTPEETIELDEVVVSGTSSSYTVKDGDRLLEIAKEQLIKKIEERIQNGEVIDAELTQKDIYNAALVIADATGSVPLNPDRSSSNPNGRQYDLAEGGNGNHLREGQTLTIPSLEELLKPHEDLKKFTKAINKGSREIDFLPSNVEAESPTSSFASAAAGVPAAGTTIPLPAPAPRPTAAPGMEAFG